MGRARKYRPPAPRRRPDTDRTWTADDALREYARLIQWFGSGDGVRGVYRFYHDYYDGEWPDNLPDAAARWQHAEMTARSSADALRLADPIWCDPPMVDLLAAAADTTTPPACPGRHRHLRQAHAGGLAHRCRRTYRSAPQRHLLGREQIHK